MGLAVTRSLGRAAIKADPGVLYPLDRWLLRGVSPGFRMPLVAIVGPPRVGSTLLYQLLVHCLEVEYISNLQYLLFRSPYIGYLASRRVRNTRQENYQSTVGYVRGLGAPAEANDLWAYWFDLHVDEHVPQPSQKRLAHIGRTFEAIFTDAGLPLVTKVHAHAFYFQELQSWFDRPRFVRLSRDPIAVTLSILRARQRLKGSIDRWWSVRPRECSSWKTDDPYLQVALQVVATERRIDEYSRAHPDHLVSLTYEDVCADPCGAVRAVAGFLDETSVPVMWKPGVTIPPSFSPSTADGDSPEALEVSKALAAAQRLLSDHG
jgi:hypothetical protein